MSGIVVQSMVQVSLVKDDLWGIRRQFVQQQLIEERTEKWKNIIGSEHLFRCHSNPLLSMSVVFVMIVTILGRKEGR